MGALAFQGDASWTGKGRTPKTAATQLGLSFTSPLTDFCFCLAMSGGRH